MGKAIEAEAVVWLPPRDSNPDMLIQRQLSYDCRIPTNVDGVSGKFLSY